MPSYSDFRRRLFAPAMAGAGAAATPLEIIMAERKRVRRNTLERRCLGKAFKRLFVKSPKGVFKMLEKIKRV
ncbi:hypothetical protein CX042_16705 [Bordetella pertussis]|uniref:Exported protein n=30 Tax=Alcaligenaceae TaxID=506 RepID=Q7VU83_BORPE|nr:hypothetical protein BPTD_3199 [Bordetella pertussis CS]AIW91113.1 hypothetical protein B1917_0583 [Bordetella pertussis B1917]AIW96958.1 hypothetical protein B1920_3265 [Bordetella pertussis B1920]AJB27721.1 hypothetical protein Q425_32190 [Bordetella pertussis 137]ALH48163.1 hypothetical protein B1838_0583 [Bordetella pertussis]AMG90056.2 hypothetical protein AL472_21665 [Bordetella bronchiseptica]ARP75488.1 hypothetical protein CAL11_04750 [Bordetella genomosp. 6]PNO99298.1 hypothetica